MKKLISVILALSLMAGIFVPAASALSYDSATQLPKLTEAPLLKGIIVENNTIGDADSGCDISVTVENSAELMNIVRGEAQYSDEKKYYENPKCKSIDYSEYDIQLAYSFDGGNNYINTWDWDTYYPLDTYTQGSNIYDDLPSHIADDDFTSTYDLLDLSSYVVVYTPLSELNPFIALMTQGKGYYTGGGLGLEDDENRFGYNVNFNTESIKVKARYRFYCEYTDLSEDFSNYASYSPWSDVLSYDNSIEPRDYDISDGGELNPVKLSVLQVNEDIDDPSYTEYLIGIEPDAEFRKFLSSERYLRSGDFIEDIYGYYNAGEQYIEMRINDGEWLHYSTFDGNSAVFSEKNYQISEFLHQNNITTHAGDMLKIRMKYSTPCSGDESPYAYSGYSNEVSVPLDGVYRINYNLNDGSFASGTTQIDTFASSSTAVINLTAADYIPEKYGYEFDGWYTDGNFSDGSKVTSIDTKIKKYYDVYAKWSGDEYEISYVLGSQNVYNPNPDYYTPLMNDIILADPTLGGAEFEGWYTSSDFKPESKVTSVDTEMKSDIILYAKWKFPEYNISYILNGGTNAALNPAKFTVTDDGTKKLIFDKPEKKGHIFDGWYTDPEFRYGLSIGESGKYEILAYGNITIYAKWILGRWNINYVYPAGISPYNTNPDSYTYGTAVNIAAISTAGYEFDGWFMNPGFSEPQVNITATDEGEKTYYAKFTEKTYGINYITDAGAVHPDAAGITNLNPASRKYTDTTVLIPAGTDENYSFLGWYNNVNFSGQPVTALSGDTAANITLWAKWERTQLVISYELNGGINNSANPVKFTPVSAGPDAIILPANRTGYDFVGWYYDITLLNPLTENADLRYELNSDTAVTLYAEWNECTYTVNYVLNSDTASSPAASEITNSNPGSRLYTFCIILSDPSAPANYRFMGWYDNDSFEGRRYDDVTGAQDITLYAKWVRYTWGDVDFNGSVTSADARLLLRSAVGLESLSADALAWGNLDLKEGITSADARLALRMAVGLDSALSLKLPAAPASWK